MFSKKGLSDIVTNVLIILLVLVAIGIIWAFVRPTITESAQQVEGVSSTYGTVFTIESGSVQYNSGVLSFVLQRSEQSAEIAGFNIIIEDDTGNSVVVENGTILQPLWTRLISINYASTGLTGSPVKVSVAPILLLTSGEKRALAVTSSAAVPTATGGSCTDGNTQACNAGTYNYLGVRTCSGGVFGSCDIGSQSCGDGTVNVGSTEQCDQLTPISSCNFQGNINYLNGTGTCSTCTISCNQCYADLDGNNILDGNDCIYAESQGIDVNGDGFVSGDDKDQCDIMVDTAAVRGTKYCTYSSCVDAGYCY